MVLCRSFAIRKQNISNLRASLEDIVVYQNLFKNHTDIWKDNDSDEDSSEDSHNSDSSSSESSKEEMPQDEHTSSMFSTKPLAKKNK